MVYVKNVSFVAFAKKEFQWTTAQLPSLILRHVGFIV